MRKTHLLQLAVVLASLCIMSVAYAGIPMEESDKDNSSPRWDLDTYAQVNW